MNPRSAVLRRKKSGQPSSRVAHISVWAPCTVLTSRTARSVWRASRHNRLATEEELHLGDPLTVSGNLERRRREKTASARSRSQRKKRIAKSSPASPRQPRPPRRSVERAAEERGLHASQKVFEREDPADPDHPRRRLFRAE